MSPRKEGGFFQRVHEEMQVRNYSPSTVKSYLHHLSAFVKYVAPLHPRQAEESDIRRYLVHLLEERNQPASSVNQAFNALRFLYVELYDRPLAIRDLPRPRKERKLPDVLNEEEIMRLFICIRNLKHRTMIMFAYATGLRVSELVSMRIEDIDRERGLVHVREAKGRKDRYTLLPASILNALHRYWREYGLGDKGWLFPGAQPNRHLSIRSIQTVFERAVKAAGVTKPVSMHTLRHTFATHLLEHGTDLRYIQSLLGHQSVRTTEIYTHVSNRELGKVRSPLDFLLRRLEEDDKGDAGKLQIHEV